MRTRNSGIKPEKKEIDRTKNLSRDSPIPSEIRMGLGRVLLKDKDLERYSMEPRRFYCSLGERLLDKWGWQLERIKIDDNAKSLLKEQIKNFRKMNPEPLVSNVRALDKMIGEYGKLTAPSGRPNPFRSHIEYCLNCREKIQEFETKKTLIRQEELRAIIHFKCRDTPRIFDDPEIEFMDTLVERRDKWNYTIGAKLLKNFNCQNKEELIFLYSQWRLMYENQYGKLETYGVNIDDLRRNPKSK